MISNPMALAASQPQDARDFNVTFTADVNRAAQHMSLGQGFAVEHDKNRRVKGVQRNAVKLIELFKRIKSSQINYIPT